MKVNSLCFLKFAEALLVFALTFWIVTPISGQISLTFHSSKPTDTRLNYVCSTQGGAGEECFVVGDSGTILLSLRGNSWTRQQSGTANDLLCIAMNQIAGWSIVAVGKAGTIAAAIRNGNGTVWNSQGPRMSQTLKSVTFGRGVFVTVGDNGMIMTSPDDSNWTIRTSGTTQNLRAVGYPIGFTTGSLIAVGDSGTILTSSDGVVWTKQISGTTKNLNAVASGQLLAGITTVIVGDSGTILASTDGVTWNRQTSGTNETLRGAFCAVDDLNLHWIFFIAVGDHGTIVTSYNDLNYMQTSPGHTWSAQTSGTTTNLHGATWGSPFDSLVTVGDSGIILTSFVDIPYKVGITHEKNAESPKLVSFSNGTIFYTLTDAFPMSMSLCDLKGRVVKTLVNQMQQPGSYRIPMPKDILQGVYTITVNTGVQRFNRTLIVSK